MNSIQYSKDVSLIDEWAKECLQDELYMEGRVLKYVFMGEAKILCMAYIKGVGCSLYHKMPERFYRPKTKRWFGSVYVRPEYRHQGVGTALSEGVYKYHLENFPEGLPDE